MKYIVIIVLIFLDALSKLSAEFFLGSKMHLIPGVFSLSYMQNPGIAFSLPLTGVLLKIITIILISLIIWYYYTHEKQKKCILIHTGYALIIAGALGNAWERIFRGYVTDFLHLHHFSVFNLADSYITVGAIILGYIYLKKTSCPSDQKKSLS